MTQHRLFHVPCTVSRANDVVTAIHRHPNHLKNSIDVPEEQHREGERA